MAATTITAREAAERLDVSTQRLRQLISTGDVRAEKFGRVWAVDPKSVDDYRRRRRPTAGRSLSSKMTWAALLSNFGTDISDELVRVFGLRRTEETRLAHLSQRVPEAWRWLAQRRATAETFETRDALLDRIASRDDVVRTGVSALADYDVDLVAHAKQLDVYLPAEVASELKNSMRLQSTSMGNLTLRSIDELDYRAFIMEREVMPRSVVAVDLVDDADIRTSRAGCDLIRGHSRWPLIDRVSACSEATRPSGSCDRSLPSSQATSTSLPTFSPNVARFRHARPPPEEWGRSRSTCCSKRRCRSRSIDRDRCERVDPFGARRLGRGERPARRRRVRHAPPDRGRTGTRLQRRISVKQLGLPRRDRLGADFDDGERAFPLVRGLVSGLSRISANFQKRGCGAKGN